MRPLSHGSKAVARKCAFTSHKMASSEMEGTYFVHVFRLYTSKHVTYGLMLFLIVKKQYLNRGCIYYMDWKRSNFVFEKCVPVACKYCCIYEPHVFVFTSHMYTIFKLKIRPFSPYIVHTSSIQISFIYNKDMYQNIYYTF